MRTRSLKNFGSGDTSVRQGQRKSLSLRRESMLRSRGSGMFHQENGPRVAMVALGEIKGEDHPPGSQAQKAKEGQNVPESSLKGAHE